MFRDSEQCDGSLAMVMALRAVFGLLLTTVIKGFQSVLPQNGRQPDSSFTATTVAVRRGIIRADAFFNQLSFLSSTPHMLSLVLTSIFRSMEKNKAIALDAEKNRQKL